MSTNMTVDDVMGELAALEELALAATRRDATSSAARRVRSNT
jgi:hypothetical protein